jgi:hypothetical protein
MPHPIRGGHSTGHSETAAFRLHSSNAHARFCHPETGRRRDEESAVRGARDIAATGATLSLLHLKLIPPLDRTYSAAGRHA